MVHLSTSIETTPSNLVADFLRLYRARSETKEPREEVRLWLELLELLVLVSHRGTELPALWSRSTDPVEENEDRGASDELLLNRRQHWVWERIASSLRTDQERGIYSSWDGVFMKPLSNGKNQAQHSRTTLGRMNFLFFIISARIASFIDQGISETWAELAAQFMIQAALNSCRAPIDAEIGGIPLAPAFAWGWIPPASWAEYYERIGDRDTEPELLINDMFYDEAGEESKEKRTWQETRLRCLSLFDLSHCYEPPEDSPRTRLKSIAKEHPIQAFEEKVVVFLNEMWKFCRKPLLVQIEEGEVEGMTSHELEEFKRNVFVAI